MNKKNILIATLSILGVALIITGSSLKYSFAKSQKELVKEIESNITDENYTIPIPKAAITEYQKASKKDPEQFPPIQESELKEYYTQRAKTTGIIEIPAINVKAGVIEGVSPKELAISAGRYTTSATPDMSEGNMVIASHVSGPVPVFQDLNKVKIGDEIFFNYRGTKYKYIVTKTFVAQPYQIEILDTVPGKKTVTIFTCTNKGKQRTVVQAEITQ